MLEYIYGFRTSLGANLNTTSDTIQLNKKYVDKLKEIEEGNHVYLTIAYLDRYEVVKFTNDSNCCKCDKINVTRDVLGKGRKNFPKGTCVFIDWNPVQLKEFMEQQGAV